MPHRRILVYGVTGSGKTTFARELGQRLGVPMVEIDQLTWEAGWTPVSAVEQRRRVEAVCAQDAWIVDAGYRIWLDAVLARADLIIGLDYPRHTSLFRLVRRTLMRLIDRETVCNGNVETLRQAFSRQSIVLWHFRSFERKRATMRDWAAHPPCEVILFADPRDAERWLAAIGQVPSER